MNVQELACISIKDGNASRYIKPRWFKNGVLSTEAFDLREGPPPELYVSHFMATGEAENEVFKSAYDLISQRISTCYLGLITFLDVNEALIEVNDEAEPFIEFVDKKLPHCGLIYKTSKQEKIQEAKATLCVLAGKKITHAKSFASQVAANKQIN